MALDSVALDVIAVGAHPDDVEIGCGGTIAALVARGIQVGIVDLTDGEPTPHSSGPQQRLAEAQAAARVLGVCYREQLGFPNRKLFDSCEVRVALAKVFRRHRPRLVLGMADKTPLASPDHAQTVAITEAALFYSRLTKWDDLFDHIPVHTVGSLLSYYLPSGLPSLPSGQWPLVIDISKHLSTKLDAIACYKSQFPPEKASIFERVESLAKVIGMSAGCAAGELLSGVRMPVVRDVMQMF